MSMKKFTRSAALTNKLAVQRNKTLQYLGAAKYQQTVATYFPMLQQVMTERNCCAITAACALLLESQSDDPLEKNLVACAGYDLALAS